MRPYTVRETITTIRHIDANSEEEALEQAKKMGCTDFDEIDTSKESVFSVYLDLNEEKLRRHEMGELTSPFFDDGIRQAADDFRDGASATMHKMIVDRAKTMILETSAAIAPDATTFEEAMHEDGPTGVHTLIVVEDAIAAAIENRPEIVDLMRSSIEWDTQVRTADHFRAALALVNEAYALVEAEWEPAAQNGPRP